MKRILFLFLFVAFVPVITCASDKSYFADLVQYRNQVKTLEGCKNKHSCGNYGYASKVFSPEGLCKECEFKQYPERFVACPFCRRPTTKYGEKMVSFPCLRCRIDIERLLVQALKLNDDMEHVHYGLEIGAHEYFNKIPYEVYRKCIPSLGITGAALKCQCPGMYRGVVKDPANPNTNFHLWTHHLVISPNDRKAVVDHIEGEKLIRLICAKYQIFGPETGTPMIGDVPPEAFALVEKINEDKIADKPKQKSISYCLQFKK